MPGDRSAGHAHGMRGRLVIVGVAVVAAVVLAVVLSNNGASTPSGTATTATAVDPVAAAMAATPPVSAQFSDRGVNLTGYQPDVFPSPTAAGQLDAIAATGATTVSIVITWYEQNKTSNDVQPDGAKSATDDGVRTLAAAAASRGLTVALKPHVDVLDGTFRGEIAPSDPAAWMRSYTGFVTHVADLAASVGAGTLVVGTELQTLSGRTDDWRALIAQVRQKFHGRLTYAANWVDEAERINFWDALDIIGIDAYMPLVKDNADPTVRALVQGWQQWRTRLEKLSGKVDRSVLFTELGYASRLGAAEQPSQEGSGAISQPAQARLYEAAFRVWRDVSWFAGIWWWDWPGDGGDPARDAGSYPPVGKLAESTLTRWLRTAPEAPATTTPLPAATTATAPPPTPAPTAATTPAPTTPAPTTPTTTVTVTVTTPAPAPTG